MSLGAITILAANLLPLPAGSVGHVLKLRPDDLATERAVIMRLPAQLPRTPARDEAAKLTAPTDPRPELALFAGDRLRGQVEIGALGGGRGDAPSLLHVGVGFDF